MPSVQDFHRLARSVTHHIVRTPSFGHNQFFPQTKALIPALKSAAL